MVVSFYCNNLALHKHMSISGLMSRLSLIGIHATWQLSLGVFVDEDHSKLLVLYWLPKLPKQPYVAFIANFN